MMLQFSNSSVRKNEKLTFDYLSKSYNFNSIAGPTWTTHWFHVRFVKKIFNFKIMNKPNLIYSLVTFESR